MNDKQMKYKDLEVKCECGRKIKFAYPIPALSEYHDDMYISQEMEYQERKQLQSNWNSLREYCKEYADKDTMSSIIFGVVLDKMNELEGVDNENN